MENYLIVKNENHTLEELKQILINVLYANANDLSSFEFEIKLLKFLLDKGI